MTKKLHFIHVPKTAGTTTTLALSGILGDRFQSHGHAVCNGPPMPWVYRAFDTDFVRERDTEAGDIVFSLIRNPYDLLVSMYCYGIPYTTVEHRHVTGYVNFPFNSFRDFVTKLCDPEFPWFCPPQQKSLFFQLYDANGFLVPDFLIRQEMLEEGLNALVRSEFGVSVQDIGVERPTEKRGFETEDFFDADLKRLVDTHFACDISAFGYGFGSHDGIAVIDARENKRRFSEACGEIRAAPGSGRKLTGTAADRDLHAYDILNQMLFEYRSTEILRYLLERVMRRYFSFGPESPRK